MRSSIRRDFPRYAQLDAIPVLSMQWEKPAPDTIDNARDYLGPARFKYMEPAGSWQPPARASPTVATGPSIS